VNEPIFLTLDEVYRIHARSLAEHGGSDGVRDPGLVESALASAKNVFYYAHGDVFDVAAGYAFHLAESQAFNDGNKRTAAAAAITFLTLNDVRFPKDDGSVYNALIEIAQKRLDKPGLANVLRTVVEKKL